MLHGGSPSLNEARGAILSKIDMKLYSATVDKDRGLSITYARNTQRNRNRKSPQHANDKLAKHNKRTINNSYISMCKSREFAQYVHDGITWRRRRASWVYGKDVAVALGIDTATPLDIVPPIGGPVDKPEGGDISGAIQTYRTLWKWRTG